MYVPLYTAKGVLTAPLRKDGKVLSVDETLRNQLIALNGSYTYLKLEGEAGVEIVRAYGISIGAYIQRGVDNTEALEFNAGDTVEYTLTAAGIEDSAPAIPLTLNVTGGLRRLVDIEYIPLNWTAFGATEFVGEYPDLIIGRDEQAYGCCDGNNDPAKVPANLFYLTSKPYPLEVTECLGVEGYLVAPSQLWTRPLDNLAVQGYIPTGTLRAILRGMQYGGGEVAPRVPENIRSAGALVDGTLRQILRTMQYGGGEIAPRVAESVTSQGYFIGGSIQTILIRYSNWPLVPDTLKSQGALIAGTLV